MKQHTTFTRSFKIFLRFSRISRNFVLKSLTTLSEPNPILVRTFNCQLGLGQERKTNMDAPRTREDLKEDLESITDQIHQGIEKGRYTLSQLQSAVSDRTRYAAESTDQMVHDNPWAAIGVAAAIGVLVGLIMPRR
jgi:ElaB/YqjD/DUF883 family membrane-anchored ribosome-binding protein